MSEFRVFQCGARLLAAQDGIDIVLFMDWGWHEFYALHVKQCGLHFKKTAMEVAAGNTQLWRLAAISTTPHSHSTDFSRHTGLYIDRFWFRMTSALFQCQRAACSCVRRTAVLGVSDAKPQTSMTGEVRHTADSLLAFRETDRQGVTFASIMYPGCRAEVLLH